MSGETVRFLHASDLKLGAPLFGVAGLPADLRDCMINARYRAAERVFDVALAEGAEFVVLSGNVISELGPGSRGLWFLMQQCERLARRNIGIYWVEESRAQVRWSDFVPLPANVFLAESQLGQTFEHHCRGGEVRIAAGLERHCQAERRRTIAVLPEGIDGLPLTRCGVDYWALGGRSEPGVAPALSGLAQYAGTPQGQDPSETGPRGCVLVSMDGAGACTSQFITTDSVRWHDERVEIGDDLDWTRLRQLLPARQQRIVRACDSDAVMIRWTLAGHGGLWRQLLRDDVCRQLLGTLFKARSTSGPAVWNLVIDVVPDAGRASMPSESTFRHTAADSMDPRIPGSVLPEPHFVRQRVRAALRITSPAVSDARS
jgi:DNA repair exonuclease SbcCD nuclease subunit